MKHLLFKRHRPHRHTAALNDATELWASCCCCLKAQWPDSQSPDDDNPGTVCKEGFLPAPPLLVPWLPFVTGGRRVYETICLPVKVNQTLELHSTLLCFCAYLHKRARQVLCQAGRSFVRRAGSLSDRHTVQGSHVAYCFQIVCRHPTTTEPPLHCLMSCVHTRAGRCSCQTAPSHS